MYSTLYLILEIIGTIAFSISGAAVALKKRMDIFGVIILGLCASFGGGILRDLLLGITPPTVFKDPLYACVSIISSLIVFIPGIRMILHRHTKLYESVLLIMDSIGLGVFTVIGIQTALTVSDNIFLMLFVGTLTGVGGGVLRDVLAGETPYIFIKHFYACASLIGGIVCIVLEKAATPAISSLLGCITVIILRILAARFKWKLPKSINFDE